MGNINAQMKPCQHPLPLTITTEMCLDFFYLPTLLQGYIEPLRVQKKLEFNLF